MSTEAEKNRSEAAEHVKAAIKKLSTLVVDQCPGTDEFNRTYRDELHRAMNKLIEVRNQIGL